MKRVCPQGDALCFQCVITRTIKREDKLKILLMNPLKEFRSINKSRPVALEALQEAAESDVVRIWVEPRPNEGSKKVSSSDELNKP